MHHYAFAPTKTLINKPKRKKLEFITLKKLLVFALFGIRVTKPGIQVTNVVTLKALCCRAAQNTSVLLGV
jgi:hypothetical protein